MKQEKIKKPSALTAVHLPFKEREYFMENFSLLLKAGVPIGETIDSLAAGVRSRAFKKALNRLNSDIDAGYGIADALERSQIASGQTLALVRLGEASGNLVQNLEIAAQQESKHHVFVSKVRSAFIYPTFVIVLTIVIGLAVAWFLLPRLADTFAQLRVSLPPISQALINAGLYLREHGVVAVPSAGAGLLFIIYVLFLAPKTKSIGRSMLLKTPGIGRLLREVEIAQFGYLLGTLMAAGLSITQALKLLSTTTGNPSYRKFYIYLAASIDNGDTFKQSMARYKKSAHLFPPSVQQMIIAGERSGSLPEVLLNLGRTYEQKSDTTTQNLETLIEPVLLVTVAGGVLLVAVAVILPIYSLIGGLNQ
jgi:type IV pilus assembly protein PilC